MSARKIKSIKHQKSCSQNKISPDSSFALEDLPETQSQELTTLFYQTYVIPLQFE